MEDFFENDNLDPEQSRESSSRTKQDAEQVRGFVRDSQRASTLYEMEVTLASSKKETRKESEGQLTIDVFQTEDDVIIQSTIAGVSDKDLDISVTNDMVTIRGARTPEQKVRPSDYYYQELYWGPFSRSVILPVDIDTDNAKASMKNGILTIRLPKLDKIRTKKIRVS